VFTNAHYICGIMDGTAMDIEHPAGTNPVPRDNSIEPEFV